MGDVRPFEEAKLICGIIAADAGLVARAEEDLEHAFGPVELKSETFPFDSTDYYEREMGPDLVRRFTVFRGFMDPADIAGIKIRTNAIEEKYAEKAVNTLRRRVNLDPGYVTAAKVVLATTKNFSHRVYLRDGIYGEITLNFKKDGCKFFNWTYPDFKSGRYTPFLLEVRRRVMAPPERNAATVVSR